MQVEATDKHPLGLNSSEFLHPTSTELKAEPQDSCYLTWYEQVATPFPSCEMVVDTTWIITRYALIQLCFQELCFCTVPSVVTELM